MGMVGVMQHDDTPHEQIGILSLDGSTEVLEGSTIVLCSDGDIGVLEGTKVYGQFLMSHAHSYVITYDLFIFSSSATNDFILNIPHK
jgi:hypothetical protein